MKRGFAQSRPGGRSRRAVALILVMWIALGLVSVALYFAHAMQLANRAAENVAAGLAARQALDGTARYVAFILENVAEAGRLPSVEDEDYEAEAIGIGEATSWIVGRDVDTDVAPREPVFGLVDEASKLNLNTATLEMLEALPDMPLEVAAAIVDWRDEDEDLTSGGAESQAYLALDEPYSAKNGPFESVDELRLVWGMDTKLLYGEDANGNGVLDPNEDDGDSSWPADNSNGELDGGLAEYLTAWSSERNQQEDGSERVNLTSTSSRQELTTLLNDQLGSSRGSEVLGTVQATLPAMTSVMQFYLESGMTEDELAKVEEALTVSDDSYLTGLVNVATAPAAVLACLPGMTESTAAELVGVRRELDDDARYSIAWVGGALERETAIGIGPYLTSRVSQYSADIVAVGAAGRGLARERVIFNFEDEAVVIYRRDLARLGWPLGDDLRIAIAEAVTEQ